MPEDLVRKIESGLRQCIEETTKAARFCSDTAEKYAIEAERLKISHRSLIQQVENLRENVEKSNAVMANAVMAKAVMAKRQRKMVSVGVQVQINKT